ncbi:MAG: 4Fe-4S binding protein [Kiloniellales bacterium]|nr:4Fe-4S binding protein [Kiloniellales bacterium]
MPLAPILSRFAAILAVPLLLATAGIAVAAEADVAAELFEVPKSALSVGGFEGKPPAAEVRHNGQLLGYLVSSQAAIGSVGYSGKPVDVWLAIDLEANVAGAKLIAHQEPILVIGVTPEDLEAYVSGFAGLDLATGRLVTDSEDRTLPDAVAGATVSSAVIKDAILRSGRAIAAARGLLGGTAGGPTLDRSSFEPASWTALLDRGALVRRDITRGEVANVLGETPPSGSEAGQTFITLLAGLATPPSVGQNLLGRRTYESLLAEMGAEDNLLLIAAEGLYSFKGTSYRRSGVFERVELRQDALTIKLTSESYRNVEALSAEAAPDLREIGVFKVPATSGFDPARPWELVLLVKREAAAGGLVAATFSLRFRPPAWLFVDPGEDAPSEATPQEATLWQEIWRDRAFEIAALALLLLILAAILTFQDSLARHYRLYRRVRIGFLVVTLVWLGWIAGAQLSVVNVLTFIQALLTGFQWELFLLDPLIFVLWGFVAVGLLFFGRGVFCGWLCPFGALQELLNIAAQRLRIPQVPIPFALHERLWPIKYILFLGLFAISLHSVTLAFRFAEIEPFKTAIALKFLRDWPYLLYAVGLLGIGLFVQRFFCRYLCPLGAALAIPARLRMFEWLKRKVQCGRECRICASRCPVQAIHPLGQINPNECIHCLNCQTLYYDATTCPPLVARAQRRARASQAAAAAEGKSAS